MKMKIISVILLIVILTVPFAYAKDSELLPEYYLSKVQTSEMITVSGRVVVPAEKNRITVMVLEKSKDIDTEAGDAIEVGQTTVGADGEFTYSFNSKKAADVVGVEEYIIYVGVPGAQNQYWSDLVYMGLNVQDSFVEEINKSDLAQMHTLINDSKNKVLLTAMGLIINDYYGFSDTNKLNIDNALLNGKKTVPYTLETFVKYFNTSVTVEKINLSEEGAFLSNLDLYCEEYNIKTVDGILFKALEDDRKSFIKSIIYSKRPYADISVLFGNINTADFLFRINNANYDKISGIMAVFEEVLKLNTITEYVNFKGNDSIKNSVSKLLVQDSRLPFQTMTDFILAFKGAYNKAISGSSGGGNFGGGNSGGGNSTIEKYVLPKDLPDEQKSNFKDLDSVSWAAEAIDALYKKGIISGKNENEFAPNDVIKREEFIKIVVTAFDLLDNEAVCGLDDVKKTDWFYPYVASALKHNIIKGYENNTFGVSDEITREQMAAIIYRVSLKRGVQFDKVNDNTFSDLADVSDYAVKSVEIISGAGIINGVGNNMFAPKFTAKRAEAAKLVYSVMAR